MKLLKYTTLIFLTAFTLLTLFLSSSVIFDWFGIRAKEGNYVLFVVWANFVASLIYGLAIYYTLKNKKWSYKLLIIATVLLLFTIIGLDIHINTGGIYELKTVKALYFRSTVTTVFALFIYIINRKQGKK